MSKAVSRFPEPSGGVTYFGVPRAKSPADDPVEHADLNEPITVDGRIEPFVQNHPQALRP
jgi:hypothetical protein